ncbi:hypothetical protein T07_7254 [Trichinella nelsoni]|uniref:Uncharacterized protein n=1 Tax=Trichinella nelsoni TaxID=6336 RepID=A0A0V0RBQ6_9BILA|nr:hypothetical protein T07_7254 [Trichinella nelsoni]
MQIYTSIQGSNMHLQERMNNKPHEFTAVNSDPAKSENV